MILYTYGIWEFVKHLMYIISFEKNIYLNVVLLMGSDKIVKEKEEKRM